MKANQITKVETLSETEIRLHFADGTTLRMSRQAYERGTWKNGTSLGLVKAVQGTTLEDLQSMRDAELEFCYESGTSIEDANN
jgi:hypothetical protein